MTTRIHSAFAAVCALVMTLVVATGVISPGPAYAAVSAVYTAPSNPTYENPVTGVIEDSAGTSNVALGESMVSSIVYGNALVERDVNGVLYASLRFKLADQISGMKFETSTDGSTYETAAATQMQTGTDSATGAVTADYRFAVPSEKAIVRCTLDVIPMGRSVICFVSLGALQEGNVDGTFVQTVTPGEGTDDTAPVVAVPDDGTGATEDELAQKADESSDESTDGSSNKGVQEFNQEGSEVTGDAQASDSLDAGTIAMIVGIAVAVAAVAGVVVYVAYVRPKRARQAAAAAAAASASSADESADDDRGAGRA